MMFSLSGENYALEIPAGIVMTALTIFIAVRFGILALCFGFFASQMLTEAPLTLELSRWYAARGLLLAGIVVAVAVYAFRVSLGGQPVFGAARLEET
jgi:hypothetical protein